MAELRLSDDELRRQIEAAREAERIADRTEPRARDAYYDPETGRLVVELKLGGAFAFLPSMYDELEGLTPGELRGVQPAFGGEVLEWEDQDIHLGVTGVLVRMLGPALPRAFAQKGGSATSERKAAAARANGARGGRPRKQPPEPFRYDFGTPRREVSMARETPVPPEERTPYLPLDEDGMPVGPRPKPRRGRKKQGE